MPKSPIDAYVEAAPDAFRPTLRRLVRAIRVQLPSATENISYGIPTFDLLGKHLVHFAAFKTHIGFFPTSSGVKAFSDELEGYDTSNGTIRVPLDRAFPFGLVRRIVAFRKREVISQTKAAGKKICNRGHALVGRGSCLVCWPGRLKKRDGSSR